jgi:pyruvate dehydrogenase E1 component beta subunit
MTVKTYYNAIATVLAEEMRRDPAVFVMGEDIAEGGGTFSCTKGLLEEFGQNRVRNTPISECGFVGMSLGAAICGLRPVVELMFLDFACNAMDQIINQISKARYMSGGTVKVPLVLRGPQGGWRGKAAQHSQSLETLYMHVPGLKVVCPSSPYNVAGLLRASIRSDDPVIFCEHKNLIPVKGEVPDDPEFIIPLGKADVVRQGKDVTVIASLMCVHFALEVAEKMAKEGVDVEVVDVRTLVPLDKEGILASVRKTGRAVVAHEAMTFCGWGSEISSIIMEEAFEYLDAPVARVGAKYCPIPYAKELEDEALPSVADIEQAIRRVLA